MINNKVKRCSFQIMGCCACLALTCILLAACQVVAGNSTHTTEFSQNDWTGESAYYPANSYYGPTAGKHVRFQARFDASKWELTKSNELVYHDKDCKLSVLSLFQDIDGVGTIFAVDPYVSTDSMYKQRVTKEISKLTFITPLRTTKHSREHFGYCYDDDNLPICFVLSASITPGWTPEQSKSCVSDAELVLSTLQVVDANFDMKPVK